MHLHISSCLLQIWCGPAIFLHCAGCDKCVQSMLLGGSVKLVYTSECPL